jgi:hypothetical protein
MRAVAATLVGAIVLFIWGMCAWMVTPIHQDSMRTLPNADALTAFLKTQPLERAFYAAPMPDAKAADSTKAVEEFMNLHRQGPVYQLNYSPTGSEPMSPRVLGQGMLINLVCAGIAAFFIGLAARVGCGYAGRAGIGLLLGIFVAVAGHASLWNWMDFAANWSIPMIIDVIIGWTLVGLVQAAIIRPRATDVVVRNAS